LCSSFGSKGFVLGSSLSDIVGRQMRWPTCRGNSGPTLGSVLAIRRAILGIERRDKRDGRTGRHNVANLKVKD
jgi:hypothetical protein